ncbi:CHAT domain-containing protein [Kribbella sp. NPDC051952]|uniref:CHAT domain-containing protein n=1 Tax=Kribbella sp. NPDC051952 TaxID=3154851 RepID=UPI0034379E6F
MSFGETSRRLRAYWLFYNAVKDRDRNRYDQCWERLVRGQEQLGTLPDSPRLRRDLGTSYQLAAEIKLATGNLEEGLGFYAKAEELLSADESSKRALGRCLADLSVVMNDNNFKAPALDYAHRALELLRPYGGTYVADLERFIGGLSLGSERSGAELQDDIDRLRQDLRLHARDMGVRFELSVGLTVELLNLETPAIDPQELHDLLHFTYESSVRSLHLAERLHVLGAFTDMYWQSVPMPRWAELAARQTVEAAEGEGGLQGIARAHSIMAFALAAARKDEAALDEALLAVARHDELALATRSSMLRTQTSREAGLARELALSLAIRGGHNDLVAELIEAARLQVLPLVDGHSEYLGASLAGYAGSAVRSALDRVRPVTVNGRSRLATYYTPSSAGPPVALESAIDQVGGPGACWWGVWVNSGVVYWALRSEQVWESGTVDVSVDSPSHAVWAQALESSHHNSDADLLEILIGAWCRSYESEEALSMALGDLFVPETLQMRLAERLGSTVGPLSVVMAGNLFAMIPAAMLGLRAPSAPGRRARLLEAAVVRYAPPAVLVEHVAQHPLHYSEARSVVACLDPRSDLTFSRTVPEGAAHTLSGPAASVSGVSVMLAAGRPSVPAVFYYSGHAVQEGLGGDIEDGLALSDGILYARNFFAATDQGQPALPVPDRAVLAACASSGSGGAGSGEWLGLAASLLWAGGRQVVATNWSVWDTPFTEKFDQRLVEAMRTAPSVALALRNLQLEFLAEWRESTAGIFGLPDTDAPFPLTWAAYCCCGVY